MSESFLVLPSLVYPYFELNIEQDEIHKASLIKQETEWFCSYFCLLVFRGNSHGGGGRQLDRECLLERGV